jgi:hypothetical protein
MSQLTEYIADILARYWLEENPYCGLGALEISFRLAKQLGETPDPARMREAINKLSQRGAVSTREVQDDVWVYPKQPLLEPRDSLTEAQVGIYTKQLRLGGSQIELRFFDRQVLDRYRQDPRFRVEEGGASGLLGIRNEFYISPNTLDRDRIEILNFGVGYGTYDRRVVTVILWDLGKLPIEQQQHWASYELKERCTVDADFVKQNFEAEDTDRVSPFEAFVQELEEINRLCKLMGEPPLFRNTYGGELPEDFAWITKPSSGEYVRFVQLLDKMMSDNLNRDFFCGKVELTREEPVGGGRVRLKDKGTIELLDDYLTKYWRIPDPDEILATFRQVRKERQQPAHTVTSDAYDLSAEDKQRELIAKAYHAVRTLRLLLMKHPAAKAYETPNWLQEGRIC